MTIIMLACALTLVYLTFNFNSASNGAEAAIAVSGTEPIEVLFEHQLNRNTFLLYRTQGGDDLSLAFFTRNLTGNHLIETATQYDIESLTAKAGMNYVVLPQSDAVPFTVYAGSTTNPNLYEVFVTEMDFSIAHSIRVFESEVEGIYVWMAMSPDFFGERYSLTAVTQTGAIVADIENDGTQRVFHTESQ